MVELPLSNAFPFYEQRVILEGREYVLDLSYNQREDRWYMQIQDENGEPIISGVKVVCNVPLFRKVRYKETIPTGQLMFVDASTDEPPALADLGERVKLYYFTADEVAALSS